jgi:Transposase DDE domain group 1
MHLMHGAGRWWTSAGRAGGPFATRRSAGSIELADLLLSKSTGGEAAGSGGSGLQLALTAADLIAWTQTILLHGDLAKAEPKKLRYQLLHTAARIVHGQRRTKIKIDTDWPWAIQLATAFTRLAAIQQPPLI